MAMQEANLKIISELKAFLFSVSTNNDFLKYFKTTPIAFTRRRKLPFDAIVLLIVQLCKKSLRIELEDFFESFQVGKKCSVAAFSLQRMKLDPVFFSCWNTVLYTSFYKSYGKNVKRWKGYRVLGADGSNIALIKNPELEAYFGGQ